MWKVVACCKGRQLYHWNNLEIEKCKSVLIQNINWRINEPISKEGYFYLQINIIRYPIKMFCVKPLDEDTLWTFNIFKAIVKYEIYYLAKHLQWRLSQIYPLLFGEFSKSFLNFGHYWSFKHNFRTLVMENHHTKVNCSNVGLLLGG